MKLKEILKKQGGINLIHSYWKGGAFFTAIGQVILLGKSRTALEILRLSAQLKIKQKLKKEYKNDLIKFDKDYVEDEHKLSDKIWFCWFQGLDNAPKLVQRCYEALKTNLTQKKIIVITEKNMNDYVQFPEYILEKWKCGKITHTHMTDLLRLELLTKYGGTLIDATVLCTRKEEEIPSYFFESDLFLFQQLKPGRDGQSTYISSWFINAKSNNKILCATKYLCYKYWEKNNELIDYFLLHNFLSIVLEFYSQEWSEIIPFDNAAPHIILLRLFEQYNEDIWISVKEQTPFHKLSYKFQQEDMEIQGTYYDIIINKNHV